MNTVLIVDDDPRVLDFLSCMIRQAGYETATAGDGEGALEKIAQQSAGVVLLDLKLPGMDGLAVLEQIGKTAPGSKVIVLTGHDGIKDCVKAMKLGAYDYLSKPIDNDKLLLSIEDACNHINLPREPGARGRHALSAEDGSKTACEPPGDPSGSHRLVGKSPAIRAVLKLVQMLAPTDLTVVLEGETGVGKEVVANLIHRHSRRRDKPFVPVDCGAIPDTLTESILFGHEKGSFTGADSSRLGQFELAHEGTLFLDEIVNTSEAVQAKLLRVVQEKKVRHVGGKRDIPIDVRLITASNVSLDEAVATGKFRADLFHRLNEFVIHIPALRERREDIPVLTQSFLQEANLELHKDIGGFSPAAAALLLDAFWPGNVRELKNVVKRAVLLAENDTIMPDDISIGKTDRFIVPACLAAGPRVAARLPEPPPSSMNGKVAVGREKIEREEVAKALRATDGNKAKAARLLGIDRSTLYALLHKHRQA